MLVCNLGTLQTPKTMMLETFYDASAPAMNKEFTKITKFSINIHFWRKQYIYSYDSLQAKNCLLLE